jgi:hypothetical protein
MEERNSDLLIDPDPAEEGKVDMAMGRQQGDQRNQQASNDRDPPLAIQCL